MLYKGDKSVSDAVHPAEGHPAEGHPAEAGGRYSSLPPTKQDLKQGQMTWRSIIIGIRGEEGRTRVETRALLDYAGNRPT